MSDNVPDLVKRGLTEDEAKILAKWIDEGKPGLSKYKAERLGEIYCLGYSCKDIQKWFPEYPIEVLLWARVHFRWDASREQYRSIVQQETLNAALAARMDSIRFLSDVLSATHMKWRREILNFISDPEKVQAPKLIPDNLHTYSLLASMLKEVTAPGGPKKDGDNSNSTPLVSVTVNGQNKPEIVVQDATIDDVKKALMEDAAKDKE